MQSACYENSIKERKVLTLSKAVKAEDTRIRDAMPELFYHIQLCKDNGKDFTTITKYSPLFDNIKSYIGVVSLLENEGYKVVVGWFHVKISWGEK